VFNYLIYRLVCLLEQQHLKILVVVLPISQDRTAVLFFY
jgi:hypothetical protein